MGVFKRRRAREWRTAGRERYAIDPRVPLYETWGPRGISGTINTLPLRGEPVLARKLDLPWEYAATAYTLWFLHEEIRLVSTPDFYIESDSVDTFHTDGTGGLIDYITGPLSIDWSTSAEAFDDAETRRHQSHR
jgi:hypothetical protein